MTTGNHRLPLWPCLAILVLQGGATGRAAAAEPGRPPAPAMGQLNVEGGAVEQLTLRKMRTDEQFDATDPLILHRPGSRVSIPAGKYLLQRITLHGGYLCYVPFQVIGPSNVVLRGPELLTISPDKPCLLKVGAPLTTTLLVSRHGRVIHLAYRLLDAEGRMYTKEKRGEPPRFKVLYDGREIASGSFEYG